MSGVFVLNRISAEVNRPQMIDWTLDLFIERSIAQLQDVEHGNGKSEIKTSDDISQ